MFGKLRKNSVKIIVFGINIALAAVAVFAIRGKDQARLEENSQKENSANENTESNLLPSFKNSLNAGEEPENTDMPIQIPPAENATVVPADSASASPVPVAPAPAPAAKTNPSNAKTKTS
ncbi:MAG: hypothetical protein A2359_04870 [Candidatus Moranbacteria bacterium RIFOXYB1_FULL_43_19]|nr:MAG: hypothetical protein A2359_04870 [Candidatus Moranbacteria bacterium RIFOXYB1_FULL_43_19]OGI28353.1 MAG: hypothetical protein A2184_04240 [Candidatus Moranbacteria bacterium RIFOXYA1_FULL_44_7]OGI33585.1 MAG: hypothetical protein A2420_00500 [Candidatus Moranbacteria bacterium RIFOXYC1_FULL_44_13]OGI37129.1 MAG: hypothetical protein A2612_00030 [Candidatus Moranbacteria bacterium RIFOXYD1_FULL_44_12]